LHDSLFGEGLQTPPFARPQVSHRRLTGRVETAVSGVARSGDLATTGDLGGWQRGELVSAQPLNLRYLARKYVRRV